MCLFTDNITHFRARSDDIEEIVDTKNIVQKVQRNDVVAVLKGFDIDRMAKAVFAR